VVVAEKWGSRPCCDLLVAAAWDKGQVRAWNIDGCSPEATYRPLHPATTPSCNPATSLVYKRILHLSCRNGRAALRTGSRCCGWSNCGCFRETVLRAAADLDARVQDFEGQKLAELIANVALSLSGVRSSILYPDAILINFG